MTIWDDMQKQLDALAEADLLRRPVEVESAAGPHVRVGGRELVCLCSNDYLALAGDESVKAAAVEAIRQYGVGAGASRLVSGTHSLHVELERELATFKGTQAALLMPTGWMANQAAISALAGDSDLILCDKLNHASILDAAMSCGARVRTYAHCDMRRLRALLEKHRAGHNRCVIATDSLFSMDGDLAPLADIVELKKMFECTLLVDEAHATGVLGEDGRGAAELLGVEHEIDATVGTLSKAIGTLGGFVAGPAVLADMIRNRGRAFVYTTALPPAICAAALRSLGIIRSQPQRREKLLGMALGLRERLGNLAKCQIASDGSDTPRHVTQIIPVVIGEAKEALRVSRTLLEAGFLVPAIRPPTVPRGTSRLRVSLSAGHEMAELEAFVDAIKAAMRQ